MTDKSDPCNSNTLIGSSARWEWLNKSGTMSLAFFTVLTLEPNGKLGFHTHNCDESALAFEGNAIYRGKDLPDATFRYHLNAPRRHPRAYER
jgi:hypothetical protein